MTEPSALPLLEFEYQITADDFVELNLVWRGRYFRLASLFGVLALVGGIVLAGFVGDGTLLLLSAAGLGLLLGSSRPLLRFRLRRMAARTIGAWIRVQVWPEGVTIVHPAGTSNIAWSGITSCRYNDDIMLLLEGGVLNGWISTRHLPADQRQKLWNLVGARTTLERPGFLG